MLPAMIARMAEHPIVKNSGSVSYSPIPVDSAHGPGQTADVSQSCTSAADVMEPHLVATSGQ